MTKKDTEKFKQEWMNLHLCERIYKDGSNKVQAIRGMLGQLEFGRAAKIVCPSSAAAVFANLTNQYGDLMDSTEQEGGVNNYADGILALLPGRKNESKLWSSSLNENSIKTLPCVQKFLKENQIAAENVVPFDKANSPLQLSYRESDQTEDKPRKKPSEVAATSKSLEQYHPAASNSSNVFGNKSVSFEENPHSFRRDTVLQAGSNSSNLFASKTNTIEEKSHSLGRSMDFTGSNAPNPYSHSLERNMADQAGPYSGSWGASKQRSVLYPSNAGASTSAPTASNMPPYRVPQKSRLDEEADEEVQENTASGFFKTAREQLHIDQQKKDSRGGRRLVNSNQSSGQMNSGLYGMAKKSLGTRRGLNSKFVPPVLNRDDADSGGSTVRSGNNNDKVNAESEEVDERLKNIDEKMIELIKSEIMDNGAPITWDDIAGLHFAKKTIKEIVVWPMLRPDIFTGLRGPPKGLLLFGPPGTGKTLIGKCIASQSKSTFFSISASSLTSKWVGEGEKMVRALFAVARVHQPAVVFIDEIDSLLSQRSDGEHESSRRIKTEFLVQLDGAGTGETDRILVVGATNRPQEIDEAARRRFVKRLYIPLPEGEARGKLVQNLMSNQSNRMTPEQLQIIVERTDGYSGADMANLCREAALGPIRSVSFEEIEHISAEQVRPIMFEDFEAALKQVRASVSEKDLDLYIDWNKQYGSWDI